MLSLADHEKQRYSRQIRLSEIGIAGQLKLKRAHVMVVGSGGLGCPVLQYLVAAGVGHIGIIDHDILEVSNLHRQVLYTMEDLESPKVLRAAERLQLHNPHVSIEARFEKLTRESAIGILHSYDIVVDCTDQFSSRYLINDTCVLLGKPVVYGAVYKFEGQVTVFNYQNGPTLRCLHQNQPHPLETPSCGEGGVIGTIAGIIGTIQANEVIKIILGIGEILSGKILVFNVLDNHFFSFKLDRNPDTAKIDRLGEYNDLCMDVESEVSYISRNDLKDMVRNERNILIVDVSDLDQQFNHGFPCIRIPSFRIAENLHKIPRDHPVVFICPYGIKSKDVVSYLIKKESFDNIYSLENGYLVSFSPSF